MASALKQAAVSEGGVRFGEGTARSPTAASGGVVCRMDRLASFFSTPPPEGESPGVTHSLAPAARRAEFLGWLSAPLHEKRADLGLYLDIASARPTYADAGALLCASRLSYCHYLNMLPPEVSVAARRLFTY